MEIAVKALTGFDHYGRVRKGQVLTLPIHTANQMGQRGLVRPILEAKPTAPPSVPSPAVGAKSSALPAAQVLPQTSSSKSDAGEKPRRKRRARSSSQTPASR